MGKGVDTRHVRNVGEFFSQHYLESVLEGDLAEVFKRWRASEERTPMQRLSSLSEGYFRAMAEARGKSVEERERGSRAFHSQLLEALGYEREETLVELADGSELRLARAESVGGRPYLWIGETALPESADDSSPFESGPLGEEGRTWRELLEGGLFRQEHAPRWLLVLAGPDVLMLEREKWGEGKYVQVELGAMLGHREPSSLRAAAGLLHRDVLLPSCGRSVLDGLDDRSHKHAHAVSTELKEGVQEAIELLGNEALYFWRTKEVNDRREESRELGKRLSEECVTYLYRLLVVLFVEARGGALGVVPMEAEAYREGLSLESLRELELVPLRTPAARNGSFIHDTLERLFGVLYEGWPSRGEASEVEGVDLRVGAQRGRLFDPRRTPLLSGAKFRNHVLQRVIRLLSLSREGGRSKRRGRISYATLGINQLGSVYEGLLSYTGMIAEERVFEVQNPKDKNGRVYFVPESRIGAYRDEEFGVDADGERIWHEKGTFLFRLAGRDRERSASYYTPEVLTRSVTRQTLRERLRGLRADEILELTVCEPAMGSGAFLGEAAWQLATAYLERKQAEVGSRIAGEEYGEEHARARYHFVVHNSYGVDVNGLATELGKVSLWLGVLQSGVKAPYLDLRLRVGNSLQGARREVYAPEELRNGSWECEAPRRVNPGERRPKGHVYHFLVADSGMAAYERDRVVKKRCPEEVKALRAWRREVRRPYTECEVQRLQVLCDVIDGLWEGHRGARQRVLAGLRQPVEVWGQAKPAGGRWKEPEESERVAEELTRAGSPYRRLRAVMDYWCSLWSWPLERARSLPSREAWMRDVEELLEGRDVDTEAEAGAYLHWELEFCEVFAERGGFDVIVGNPPWRKLRWREAGVLGEREPLLQVRKHSAMQVADRRAEVLSRPSARAAYLEAFCEDNGAQQYLNSRTNFPLLQGVQTNLYKCFMSRCWGVLAVRGVQGLVHQPGIFEDPKGGELRRQLVERASLLVRAKNQLKLFADVEHQRPFAWSVTRGERAAPEFALAANILHPSTLEGSIEHDGAGPLPGVNDRERGWDLRPHASRVVRIDDEVLALFARLYDKPGTRAREARLPAIHSRELLSVLRRFADAPRKLVDLRGEVFATVCFDETGRQRDGTIRADDRVPRTTSEWIVSGPHFYVGTPLNKSPNQGCRNNQDYRVIDLTAIRGDYLPRTNYAPACAPELYRSRTPSWRGVPVTAFYRHVNRRMVAPTGERTLVSAIIPPGAAHTDLVFSIAFQELETLSRVAGMWASLPVDFFVKSTGKGDARGDVLSRLPIPGMPWARALTERALRLNCLTTHYAALWNSCLPELLLASAKPDPRVAGWEQAPRRWSWDAPLRSPYARRQALVELDALAALSLGMTLDELLLLYRVQFPVLQQNEAETFYDRRGKIVFTVNRGLAGVGVTRTRWNQIRYAVEGEPLPGWAEDAGGSFVPPFDRCDREADMAEAYAYFKEGLGGISCPEMGG